VKSIKVELYPDQGFTADTCLEALQRLGFETWIEPEWWGGYGFGVRR